MRTTCFPIVLIACCLTTSLRAQQTISGSFTHDGLVRDYRLYVPATYSAGTPVPLVFNLHGYTSDNLQQEFYGDFRPIADTANFIIAHPNGTLDGLGNRHWDTFGLGQVDDLGFIAALIDTISAHFSIDPDRVYSTGMSNGGFMSYDLACYRSDRFAAIASVTGTMIAPRLAGCQAGHPTPVMQVHGTADPTVNYNGGSGLVPIETLVAHWVQFNACAPAPVITAVPNVVTTDGCTAEHYLYSSGSAGSTVEFFKVIGGGHTWPGTPFTIGVTNQDFSASKEIWRFFSQYSLSALTGVPDGDTAAMTFTVAPNPTDGFLTVTNARGRIEHITIMTLDGRTVREVVVAPNKGTQRLDVRDLAPGTYLVWARGGETRGAVRFVKQ